MNMSRAFAAVASLLLARAALADLNPPPPPGSTCDTTGSGTICRGTADTSFSFPAEFTCGTGAGAFEVDENGTTHREFTTFYDRAGNEIKRTLHIAPLAGTFTNAATGKSVPESAHFTITRTFATPGDTATELISTTGLFAKVVVPGSGIVLQDAGLVVNDPDGDILFEAGKHQFTDGDVTALCAALQ
jgi:hypothetical protein